MEAHVVIQGHVSLVPLTFAAIVKSIPLTESRLVLQQAAHRSNVLPPRQNGRLGDRSNLRSGIPRLDVSFPSHPEDLHPFPDHRVDLHELLLPLLSE